MVLPAAVLAPDSGVAFWAVDTDGEASVTAASMATPSTALDLKRRIIVDDSWLLSGIGALATTVWYSRKPRCSRVITLDA
jgi:hypothetical protein